MTWSVCHGTPVADKLNSYALGADQVLDLDLLV
jgi:hypothetical protein